MRLMQERGALMWSSGEPTTCRQSASARGDSSRFGVFALQCWAKLRAQFQGGGFPHLKVLHPLLVIPDLPNDAIPPRSACFPSPKATVHHVQQLSECQK
ncbi:uncharacterized protein LOC115657755 isoform X3 [Gopherus evgoodei]|uniref:uncharacterized protein LOC115657755 isoform X3 n=1 Tax=Gopherus evgoodei TaxID=1825980 RepID=UPI0011CF07E7|nr:uncharacterized protein LOC115657755 isoform X3 [Gopherus evgoodei]